jgi:hypothetical protein
MSATCTTLPSSATRPATVSRPGTTVPLAHGRRELGLRRLGGRRSAVDVALPYPERSHIRAAKPRGRFHYCVQHRLHIGGRAGDDVEHVAGRGLIFEGFFEVACAGLQFAEQPRILHCNDCLVGKGAHQFDLPLGKSFDPLPREIDRADHGPLAQQRHPECGASPGRHSLGHRPVRVGADVRDLHDPAFERHPPGHAVATGDKCSLAQGRPQLGVNSAHIVVRHSAVDLAIADKNRCGITVAKPARRFGHRVQHRLYIGRRAADDVEHLTGRGLVFERFFEVARAGL